MARELNPDLFGGGRLNSHDSSGAAGPAQPRAEDTRVLHLQIEALNKRLKEFESRVETMQTKVDEMTAQNRQRFERVQGHFQRQTEMLQSALGDVHGKIAQVVSRVNERKLSESAVKEMVDRHGQVVQAFEIKLQQFQKVISEQELQLMHARSELKQALLELSRLKKY